MSDDTTFVGLDVHKKTITIAVAYVAGPAQLVGTVPHRLDALVEALDQLAERGRLSCCYEAGFCGFDLYRKLQSVGIRCRVVAPSLIPHAPGDRVKTDRRDARKLARFLRSGDLEPVWVPDEEHESLRDLTRAREDAHFDLVRAEHRLQHLLVRQGIDAPLGIQPWGTKYRAWLLTVRFPRHSQNLVFREYLLAVDQATDRLQRLEKELAEVARTCRHAPLISALQTLRGVGLVTSTTLVAELGDMQRFPRARAVMGYSGLVSREQSSGNHRRQGAITKAGNTHIRRVLIEAAWHYRHLPALSKAIKARQQGQPETVKHIAYQAQDRLHRRYWRLSKRGKPSQKIAVAIARELLGFVWAIGQEVGRSQAEAPSQLQAVAA